LKKLETEQNFVTCYNVDIHRVYKQCAYYTNLSVVDALQSTFYDYEL